MTAGWRSEAREALAARGWGGIEDSEASARAIAGRALDALDAVLALHAADEFGQCRICVAYEGYEGTTMEPWPCRTARTIEGDA